MPDGAKRWRLAYRYNGKQKILAIGVYARADYWDERVRMMDWWAGRCREMAGGIAIPMRAI